MTQGMRGEVRGDHSLNLSHRSDGGKTAISNLGITGLSKCSYILSYIVTGPSCDRVMECSTRFYMTSHEKVLSHYPKPYIIISESSTVIMSCNVVMLSQVDSDGV